jgi:hypothetical protein
MLDEKILREQLVTLLKGHGAHVDTLKALEGLPAELRGKRPAGMSHSAWEVLEHIRIAQADILDYVVNREYRGLEWPQGYWPKSAKPSGAESWEESLKGIRADLAKIVAIVSDPARDLTAQIPHGEKGHTILREALLVADHNAYHIGQMVMLRKRLNAWG